MKQFALALAMSLAVSASADLRSQIESMNRTIEHAMVRKDIKAFNKVMRNWVTPDFRYVEMGRSMSYDDMVKQMGGGFAMTERVKSADSKILKIDMKGSHALVRSQHDMVSLLHGGPKEKAHVMRYHGISGDTYVRMNGKWKLAKMEWLTEKMTLDGRPFDPAQSGAAKQP